MPRQSNKRKFESAPDESKGQFKVPKGKVSNVPTQENDVILDDSGIVINDPTQMSVSAKSLHENLENKDNAEDDSQDQGFGEDNVTLTIPNDITSILEMLDGLVLRVKIINKSSLGTKADGSSTYFSFQFTDGKKKMRGVVFGDAALDISNALENNKVYEFQKFKINSVNPKYGNGYEIIMGKETIIQELPDFPLDMSEPDYEFSLVNTIFKMPIGTIVDFLGTVLNFGAIQTYVKDSGHMHYRNIDMMDEKKFQITVAFWGELSETCEETFKIGDVMILHQVRVVEYSKLKRLHSVSQSSLVMKSSNPRFKSLRQQNGL